MSLDNKLKELKEISDKLEREEISFDESIKLYEKGVQIAKEVMTELKQAKGKITQIKQDLETFKEEEFK